MLCSGVIFFCLNLSKKSKAIPLHRLDHQPVVMVKLFQRLLNSGGYLIFSELCIFSLFLHIISTSSLPVSLVSFSVIAKEHWEKARREIRTEKCKVKEVNPKEYSLLFL